MTDQSLDYESELFTCRVRDDIAVFKFGTKVFEVGTDLEVKDLLFSLLTQAGRSPDIRTILVLNSPGALSEESYENFLRMVFTRNADEEGDPVEGVFDRGQLFSREEIAINQFILEISKCNKITVAGLQGTLAAPFFGSALAYDFRLAAEDVVFTLSHANLGVPPGGALGFFLPRYVGLGRAVDIVFSGNPIPVSEASNMGLVNAVLPKDEFEEKCIEWVRERPRISSAVTRSTKALLYPQREKELEQYLKTEFQVMQQAWVDRSHLL